MRKLLYAFGLTSALVFALAAHAAAPNFAGTWTLDKSKSQGLNPRLQNAESVTWNVTQTEKEITIDEKVAGGGGPGGPPPGGAPAAGGPPAGGAPGGGQGGGRGMGGAERTRAGPARGRTLPRAHRGDRLGHAAAQARRRARLIARANTRSIHRGLPTFGLFSQHCSCFARTAPGRRSARKSTSARTLGSWPRRLG